VKQVDFVDLRLANIQREKEWTGDVKVTPEFRAMELGGEVGEALNVVKKLVREAGGSRGSRASVDDLAAELADVVICCDLLARQYDIVLSDAVRAKFNATSIKYGLRTML
jgi:NTP pyrophosphatase (non-canonical NTP hydrolase)